jgi:NhaA family Na+:H+ antiporter
VAGLLAVLGLHRIGFATVWGYGPVGIAVCVAMLESGCTQRWPGWCLLTPPTPAGARDVLDEPEHNLHPVMLFRGPGVRAGERRGRTGAAVLADALGEPLNWAVIAGLVLGKMIGIAGVPYLARWRR